MSSPILLVSSSLLYVIILGIILFTYRFIYPKKTPPLFAVFLLIAILPVISIFRPGTYESGDLTFHTIETMVFYKSLAQGIYFPIWAGDMNFGYGYPAFLFFYQLPFYIASFFHFIGFSFLNSMKLVLSLSFVLSGVFMYLWLRMKVKEIAAFAGGLFYLFAPYHLVDLHFRVAVGEVLAFVFLPLVLLSAEKYMVNRKSIWLLILSISVFCLILSHPAISLSGVAVLLIYLLVNMSSIKDRNELRSIFFAQVSAFILGLGLASFYLVSLISEAKYTLQEVQSAGLAFVSFTELLYSPWRWGLLFQGPIGQLSYLIGYGHLFVLVLSIIYLIRRKIKNTDKRLMITSILFIFLLIFFMLDISEVLWRIIPLIGSFQFTYRLLGVTIFIFAILTALLINNIKNKAFIYLLCLFVVLSTILNWGNRRNIPEISDKVLESRISSIVLNGGAVAQAATFWSDPVRPFAQKEPTNKLEILNGAGEVIDLKREIDFHKYLVNAKTDLTLRENTLYFPGWNIYANNKIQKINIIKNNNPPGVIGFDLPKGEYIVEVKFTETISRKRGKVLTFSSILALILLLAYNTKFYSSRKREQLY